MNFTESVEYIHSLLAFGIKSGLERISMLLEMLDNPQDKLKVIHVAGTNGKGSTSTTISGDAEISPFSRLSFTRRLPTSSTATLLNTTLQSFIST